MNSIACCASLNQSTATILLNQRNALHRRTIHVPGSRSECSNRTRYFFPFIRSEVESRFIDTTGYAYRPGSGIPRFSGRHNVFSMLPIGPRWLYHRYRCNRRAAGTNRGMFYSCLISYFRNFLFSCREKFFRRNVPCFHTWYPRGECESQEFHHANLFCRQPMLPSVPELRGEIRTDDNVMIFGLLAPKRPFSLAY
jgi:hypothetical protein